MINPTNKDIGRKVVWYPDLEVLISWRERHGGKIWFGVLKAPTFDGRNPLNAKIDFGEPFDEVSFDWPCDWQALDWADDL